MSSNVRLRVAPSPTGDPHVGTAYMSLFNLAYVRQQSGQFILRIEDTDRQRYVANSERQIFHLLSWLGLDWDEGPDRGGPVAPYRQSERLETYRPYVDQLIEAGQAYYCWCSPERLKELRSQQEASKQAVTGYDRLCHGLSREQRAELPGFSDQPVVRLLIPDDVELEFDDLIRGRISAPPPDDQVILKADGFPTYHLAVVVDDHLMGISHVVRGEEWISSTPKHLLLYRLLGWQPPRFAHMPLLRNTDKSKISKRKNPAARLSWFWEQGYLPEALRNFLQLLGYPALERPGEHKGIEAEVASFDDFVANFDWAKVNTVGPVFDLEKLDALNGWYIRSLDDAELAQRLLGFLAESGEWPAPTAHQVEVLQQAVPIIKQRLTRLNEALPMIDYLFGEEVEIEAAARAALPEEAGLILERAEQALAGLEDFTAEPIQGALRQELVEILELKAKVAFNPVRTAIAGRLVSPPLFESMEILGKEVVLARLAALRNSLA